MTDYESKKVFRTFQVNIFTRIGALILSAVCLLPVDIFLMGLDVKKLFVELALFGIGAGLGAMPFGNS